MGQYNLRAKAVSKPTPPKPKKVKKETHDQNDRPFPIAPIDMILNKKVDDLQQQIKDVSNSVSYVMQKAVDTEMKLKDDKVVMDKNDLVWLLNKMITKKRWFIDNDKANGLDPNNTEPDKLFYERIMEMVK